VAFIRSSTALASWALAFVCIQPAVAGQPDAQSRGPGWLPWYSSLSTGGLTAAERTAIATRAGDYQRLFVTRDSLARPQGGFTVEPMYNGGLGPPGHLGGFGYNLIFFNFIAKAGESHEGTTQLWASENPRAHSVWILDSGPPDFKDGQGAIYRERPKGSPLPGMPPTAFVFDALKFEPSSQARENHIQVLLTADGELPWSDVSRERMLNLFIAEADAAVKKDQQALSQTTYQRWLSDAPRRRQETEQALVAIAAIDKTQVATVKEQMESSEQATGESLRENDAMERAQWGQALAADTARLTQRRSELAAMSPADRAAAAWVGGNEAVIRFTAPGAPGSYHLIADKPDYYRIKGSRLEVRSLMIGFRLTDAKPGSPGEWGDRAVTDSYKAFDWAAAARMLKPAAK